MFCHKCGSKTIEGSAFCQKCGTKLIVNNTTPDVFVKTSPVSTLPQQKKNWPVILIPVGAVILVVILVFALRDDGGSNIFVNRNVSASTNTNAISVTYGSTFRYLGIEYTIGDSWSFDEDMFEIPVNVTNISNANNSQGANVRVWGPNGVVIFGGIWYVGEMRTGVSQNSHIYFQDHGDGDYILELSKMWVSDTVDVIITLPITRSLSSKQVSGNTSSGMRTNTQSAYHGEVRYNNFPLAPFFNMTIDSIVDLFGEPSYDGYYEGGRCNAFNNEIVFIYDENTRKITHIITHTPSVLEINGLTLDKNRAGIIDALGTPEYEGEYFDEMDGVYGYSMRYVIYGDYDPYDIGITMPDKNSKVNEVWLSRYDDF